MCERNSEEPETTNPSINEPGLSVAIATICRGKVAFRTVFGEEGPHCPICGRQLSPFTRRHCKPFRQEALEK